MKINLYYDVLLVPPRGILKERKERRSIIEKEGRHIEDPHPGSEYEIRTVRFFKQISLPCLLVPGQTYFFYRDPVDGCGVNRTIRDSGVFPNGDRHVPYMVIMNGDSFDFDSWIESEVEDGEWGLPIDEQVKVWRRYDESRFEKACESMKGQGWKAVYDDENHGASWTYDVSL